jgi:hypothetical protein
VVTVGKSYTSTGANNRLLYFVALFIVQCMIKCKSTVMFRKGRKRIVSIQDNFLRSLTDWKNMANCSVIFRPVTFGPLNLHTIYSTPNKCKFPKKGQDSSTVALTTF